MTHFSLPLGLDVHGDIRSSNGRLIDVRPSLLEQRQEIVDAINYHDRMVQAIGRLLEAEKDCTSVRGVAYYAACGERIEALEALEQIHKELNP